MECTKHTVCCTVDIHVSLNLPQPKGVITCPNWGAILGGGRRGGGGMDI